MPAIIPPAQPFFSPRRQSPPAKGVVYDFAAPSGAPPLAPRKFERHPSVPATREEMKRQARDKGYASYTWLTSANVRVDLKDHAYGSGKPIEAKVRGTPRPDADGVRWLDVSVFLMASGHSGQARQFAQTNTYNLRVILPDGTTYELLNIPRSRKVEYVTVKDLSIPLQPGLTRLAAWPNGSFGPDIYQEGRWIHLTWDGPRTRPAVAAEATDTLDAPAPPPMVVF